MPIYEFYCPVCQQTYEYLMTYAQWKVSPAPVCPTYGCGDQLGSHPGLQPCLSLPGKAVMK